MVILGLYECPDEKVFKYIPPQMCLFYSSVYYTLKESLEHMYDIKQNNSEDAPLDIILLRHHLKEGACDCQ